MYNTEVLRSNFYDYNNAYILVRGNMTIAGNTAAWVAFRTCALFIKITKVLRIPKIDGTTLDDAEDLGLVMPMYNLFQFSSNYSDTTGSLWFYSKDEAAKLPLIPIMPLQLLKIILNLSSKRLN